MALKPNNDGEVKSTSDEFDDTPKSDELCFENNGYVPPRIPEGDHYEVQFVRAEKHYQWDGWKLFMWVKVLTPGEWFGKDVYMACSLPPKGRWSSSHKYWLAWVLAAGRRPTRADRMSTKVFLNKIFRVRIRIVRKTAKGIRRTAEQEYSVVDELLELLTGGSE
jgi:hypothetical protein